MTYDFDTIRDVINGLSTFRNLARDLTDHGPQLIGWTDGHGTHLDILMSLGAGHAGGDIQGGVNRDYLFVAVMRVGAFGFRTDAYAPKTSLADVDEKLSSYGFKTQTSVALADLINGVRAEIRKVEEERAV